ncbi:MAG: haloacid dehalogenase-like hydrolase [Anaerolineales bacterium]|nr:haloacid dehalogenase-like hydrolase [Anaerolineales bacterium]
MIQNTDTLPIPWSELPSEDVIFDLDGTLLEGDLGETVFYHYLLQDHMGGFLQDSSQHPGSSEQNQLKEIVLHGNAARAFQRYRSLLENSRFEEAYAFVACWIDQQEEDARVVTQAVLKINCGPVGIRIRLENGQKGPAYQSAYGARYKPGMKALAKKLLAAGADGWIVSASPQPVCEVVGDQMGFHRSRVIGVHTSEGELHTPWGSGKVTALQQRGVKNPLLAFGDSAGDCEMLLFARHGFLVRNGSDNALLAEARKYGWFVLEDSENGVGSQEKEKMDA